MLWLALALIGTAGVFLLLDAEFLAAVQVLLYAGGVVTVVVFAIVVTERLVGERLSQTSRHVWRAARSARSLLAGCSSARYGSGRWQSCGPPMAGDLTRIIGETVLTRFVLPFELLAVLLLAGLLGASYFARPEE